MSDSKLPELSGPFENLKAIASGASSTVYSALQVERHEKVALKIFHAQWIRDQAFLERLEREAGALQVLNHPNIVKLIRPWKADGHFFLELELIEGLSLKEWSEFTDLNWPEARIWILAQLSEALGCVHENQFIHRDLKLENVLIRHDGLVKLTDFGLAKSDFLRQQLTQTGTMLGSLAYMAPEVLEGKKATYKSDLFSFGVLAYELLTKTHPFSDSSGQMQIQKLLHGQFEPIRKLNAKISTPLAKVIESCLSVKDSGRPGSIWSLRAEIMNELQQSQQLPLIKKWFQESASELAKQDLFFQALQIKHNVLKLKIDTLIADLKVSDERAGSEIRAQLLSLINEFQASFPDDPALVDYLSQMTSAPKVKEAVVKATRQRRFPRHIKYAPLVLILVLLMAAGLLFNIQQQASDVVPVENAQESPGELLSPESQLTGSRETESLAAENQMTQLQKTKASTPEETIKTLPTAKPPAADSNANKDKTKTQKPNKQAQKPGTLRLLLDPGTKAFVNGRRLSSAELADYELPPGRYSVVLEKEGFLPIENYVEVKASKRTTIKAQTEPFE